MLKGDQSSPGGFWKWATWATQNSREKTIPHISSFNPISVGESSEGAIHPQTTETGSWLIPTSSHHHVGNV